MRHHHRQRHADQVDRGHLYDVLWVILVAALAYGGWKFGPPLMARFEIDQATKSYVSKINRNKRQAEIASALYDQLDSDGFNLDDIEITVDYDANKSAGRISAPVLRWVEIQVEYAPVVRHITGHTTELQFSFSRTKVWDDTW